MEKVSEKLLERKLTTLVKLAGGIALKLVAVSLTGLPDRLILLAGGKACFAEIKSTGKQLSKRQEIVKAFLERLGFRVWIIDSNESLSEFEISIK